MSRRTSTSLHRGAAPRAPRIIGAVAAATLVIGAGALLNATTASAMIKSHGSSMSTTAPALASAATFSVLAGAATTIPGATISGDVGANAALTISGSTIAGATHASADSATAAALTDATTAYNQGVALAAGAPAIPGDDLGGVTLTPGVYHNVAALADTGTVTFDAGGDPNAVFVIATDAALNTTASTTMILANSAQFSNIYFVSGGATTLGASSVFDGTIISNAAVTVGASSTVHGRVLSTTAAVTLGASVILDQVTPATASSSSTIVPASDLTANFSVLAGAAATLPNSMISGDVGAGAALTTTATTQYASLASDTAVANGLSQLSDAYKSFTTMGATTTNTIAGDDLGGKTLTAGVYHNVAALAATGDVTFSGSATDVFVIVTDGALDTTASTKMHVTGGASVANIYFISAGAATLGASSTFYGTIIANAAITVGASSTVAGTLMSVNAAVTLGDAVNIQADPSITDSALNKMTSHVIKPANTNVSTSAPVKGATPHNLKVRKFS